jgi:hypothetical protein
MSEHPYSDTERDHAQSARETAAQRAERVLAHPDIAVYLTHPPLSLPDPRMWSGYIPPAIWRDQRNDSPYRRQLIEICNMVLKREQELGGAGLGESGGDKIAPDMITDAQLAKLHICLTEYGIDTRDDKLLFLQAETGRSFTHEGASSKDLTKDEASAIIDKLTQLVRVEQERRERRNAAQGEVQRDTGRDDAATAEPGPGQDKWGDPGYDPWADPRGGSGADFDPYAKGGGEEPPY